MFNYIELLKTGKFYIEFNTKNNNDINYSGLDVEDLIRYWYRSWFDKLTNPIINWINYNSYSFNDLVEIQINLDDCKSNRYAEKDFINKADYTVGDNRNSLRRILTNGINNVKTKLPKVDCDFVITNTYTNKLDIPDPYIIKDFSVKQLNTNVVNISNVLNDLFILIEQDKDVLDKVLKEDNYLSKYSVSRNQLDKLEQLELAVNALTKYLELE